MKQEKELRVALSKFIAAKKKMSSILGAHYGTVCLEWTRYRVGDEKLECKVYRDDIGHGIASTWEEALKKLEEKEGD